MLAYTERGSGPRAVVALHGFLGSGRNLASLARRWIERDAGRRIVLPDLTGHGASPPLPPGADLETLGRDVLALARYLGLGEPFELVGHSLGGRVALVVRQVAPEAVARVTLLDIAPGPIPVTAGSVEGVIGALLAAPAEMAGRGEMREFLLARGLTTALVEWLILNLEPRAGGRVGWRIDRQALAGLNERTRGIDLWSLVEGHGAATRCIRGGRSGFVTDGDVGRLESAGVEVTTLEGAGHFVHVEAMEGLLEAVAGEGQP